MRHVYHLYALKNIFKRERNENYQPTQRDGHYDGNYLNAKKKKNRHKETLHTKTTVDVVDVRRVKKKFIIVMIARLFFLSLYSLFAGLSMEN